MDETKTYVTRAEAAEMLHRDIRTIDRYRNAGRLTTYTRLGSIVLDRSEVEQLAQPVPTGSAQSAD